MVECLRPEGASRLPRDLFELSEDGGQLICAGLRTGRSRTIWNSQRTFSSLTRSICMLEGGRGGMVSEPGECVSVGRVTPVPDY